jgi:rRNA biogenesis protein RRP5
MVQSLSLGSKIWGAVAEISPRELIISLPHGLKGHVPAAEVGQGTPCTKAQSTEAVASASWTAACSIPEGMTECAQASDVLAELMRKQERAAAAQQAEGGAAAARAARPGRGVQVPPLGELFRVGQLVRCVITELQDTEGANSAHLLHGSCFDSC